MINVRRFLVACLCLSLALALLLWKSSSSQEKGDIMQIEKSLAVIELPKPSHKGKISLEETLLQRRSRRSFKKKDLSKEMLSQILWAAQGITHPAGYRTAPSAGALYPLDLYIVNSAGIYHYSPQKHRLTILSTGDLRQDLSRAALGQSAIADAPVDIVITADYQRIEPKYGPRAERYVYLEGGHVAQNIHLQAVALGLGSVPIGALWDSKVQSALKLPSNHKPIYIIPVGYPR